MSTQPTYGQLVTLPAFAVQPVPSAFEDSNGFLNVRHYLGIGSEGLDESLVSVVRLEAEEDDGNDETPAGDAGDAPTGEAGETPASDAGEPPADA